MADETPAAEPYEKKYNVRLPRCCNFRKIQAAQARQDFRRLARRKAFDVDSVTDAELAAAKTESEAAKQVFDEHLHDESLVHG